MKAEIDDKGNLSITAETGLESFALKFWAEDYFKNCECKGEGKATLQICRIEVET